MTTYTVNINLPTTAKSIVIANSDVLLKEDITNLSDPDSSIFHVMVNNLKNHMYPINSVLMTTSVSNPTELLEFGTWTKIRTSVSGELFYWKRMT